MFLTEQSGGGTRPQGVPVSDGTGVESRPGSGPEGQRQPRRPFRLAAPALLAAFPLLVAAVTLCIRRPSLHFADDRAMIEIAVRRAATGHQLIGNGVRFGWSDLGPAAFYLLVPVYQLLGQRPFAIAVGVLLSNAVAVGATVILVSRRRGARAGYGAAALLLVYVRALGFGHFTNVWAPWEVILPLLLVCVLCAIGIAEVE
jgi:hypothetical protein